jgi:predicted AlkP superfamily phosphohydrolase/phosphomutase
VLEGGETQVASLHGPQRLLARLGLTREGVSAGLRRRGLGRLERWIKDRLGDRIELLPRSRRAEFPQAIDWSRTRAYSFGYQGQIYINLAGREPQGIVAPGQDCERLCAEISQKLAGLVDPLDGLPVVDRVYRKEEIFHGPYTGYAPDLTLIMRGLAYNTRPGYEFSAAPGRIFAEPAHGESGSHRPEGILIAAGPGIAAGGRREAASLIDLAPTILHHQGCPVPDDMDGRVLADWLTAGIQPEYIQGAAQRAESGAASLSAEDEAEIIARLKSLGYLE